MGKEPARGYAPDAALSRETSAIVAQARTAPHPSLRRAAATRDDFYGERRLAAGPTSVSQDGLISEMSWLRAQVEQQSATI